MIKSFVKIALFSNVLLISCNTKEVLHSESNSIKKKQPSIEQKKQTESIQPNQEPTSANFEFKTIKLENGWGYEIYKNSSLLITQKNIPAVQGIQTFRTEKQASKTAEFVTGKIKNGIFPPTISVEELELMEIDFE